MNIQSTENLLFTQQIFITYTPIGQDCKSNKQGDPLEKGSKTTTKTDLAKIVTYAVAGGRWKDVILNRVLKH